MFKKMLATGALALFTLTSTVFAVGAADVTPTANTAAQAIVASATVNSEEAAALQFMREEEKLAHDVYMTLSDAGGLRVFDNIAASEQKHTEAVAALLDRYEIADPAAGKALGEFTDVKLRALYDQLVAQGSKSVADALKAGAAIEEIDIRDLQERLAGTDNAAIQRVYNNLLAGSGNHLRAFVSNLKSRTGETYAPQYLSQAAYDAIITASGSQGGGNGRWGSRRGGRRP
ncbi:MAG: DUF2202 domain-containing protein [Chloroflexi bacterium]|nr:DUF2202 domain-containing protein [Chloroflexota bacterium]